ncbi:hypothetical protein [Candidatus Protochlamydia amoebophila]|uniref:Uncharacterized protein n=1 Tax=Candidatus Protochlamydia amoebophila TaxID=362787 RepID=A0A0C1JMI4_9BACT|nr:hypothetical protein [Candidatus Protochlamydia amoebophila]KIC71776.1 hypothetical protein DB44_DA00300 [Candidatus Protochlamydia amoebophila]
MILKKVLIGLTFVCFIFIGWCNLPAKFIEESKNVFESSIYKQYKIKLRHYVLTHPLYKRVQQATATNYNTAIRSLLEEIEKTFEKAEELRSSHELFLRKIRQLAQFSEHDREEEQNSKKFFEDFVNWLFLHVNLQPEMEAFLYHFINPPQCDLYSYLVETQKKLHNHPQFCSIQHQAPFEDQFLQGNLPAFITLVKETRLIRLGQPICQSRGFWSTPQISPEFLFFLKNQPHHFYVNLMKRKGREGALTRALERLEDRRENLSIITLDKNSSFYWQYASDYPEIFDSEAFKDIFLNKMCGIESHYFWSKHLEPGKWKETLQEILNHVHFVIFKNVRLLNRQERQDFIEITYLAILNSLQEKWKPSSMNITCKQGMDRGPSLMVLWMLYNELIENNEKLTNLLLTPPLVIRNRSSHRSRLDRFVSAAKRLKLELNEIN